MKKNPIERAVAPLKNDAMERARQSAREDIVRVRKELDEAGGDINKAAPYPMSMHYAELHMARARYTRFHALTKADESKGYQSNNGHRPYYVVVDGERCERYVEQHAQWAAMDYDAFVRKLVKKIGEVKSATLDGNHVWGYSTLIVTTPDGEKQAWKTQQIVNYSKHGKPFNQWPTRRLKTVPAIGKKAVAA